MDISKIYRNRGEIQSFFSNNSPIIITPDGKILNRTEFHDELLSSGLIDSNTKHQSIPLNIHINQNQPTNLILSTNLIKKKIPFCACCDIFDDDEPKIWCLKCGECYHKYCIWEKYQNNYHSLISCSGDSDNNFENNFIFKTYSDFKESNYIKNNFYCENCRICDICKYGDRQVNILDCISCKKNYHIECINKNYIDISSDINNWKCTSCIDYESNNRTICSICNSEYSNNSYLWLYCDFCFSWVHSSCVKINEKKLNSIINSNKQYKCSNCKKKYKKI